MNDRVKHLKVLLKTFLIMKNAECRKLMRKKLKENEIGLASNQMGYPLNSWINIVDYININILLVVHENDKIL